MSHQTIVVLDFGSQFTQLIARRLRELSVYSEILPFDTPMAEIEKRRPVGIVLSGGPKSVSEEGAPHCETAVYDAGVPVLGICYGMQLMTHALGGEVAPAPHREFGLATIDVQPDAPLFASVPSNLRVWASHGDFVKSAPPGFQVTATSSNAPVAAMVAEDRRLYALLFHPEVAHTDHGLDILRNFAYDVCGCTGDWTMSSFVEEATERIRTQVGSGRVVCGLSGGVDSSVAAMLIHRAIGDRLTCIFVDNGVMRQDEAEQIRTRFERLRLPLVFVDASNLFLDRLAVVRQLLDSKVRERHLARRPNQLQPDLAGVRLLRFSDFVNERSNRETLKDVVDRTQPTDTRVCGRIADLSSHVRDRQRQIEYALLQILDPGFRWTTEDAPNRREGRAMSPRDDAAISIESRR